MNSNNQIDISKFIQEIKEIAKSYEISTGKVGDMIADSFVKVYTKGKEECELNVEVDTELGTIKASERLKVVENLKDGDYDDWFEITLDDANKFGVFKVGDFCDKPFNIFDFKNFGVTQIRQIMQIFKQKLNEVNNLKVYDEWHTKVGELINAAVEKKDEKAGFYTIELDEGKNFGFLAKKECIPNEELIPGDKYKFFVKEVKLQSRGWPIILSRADSGFVKKLITLEIPEISTGEIIIEKIERIAGFKTKIAVSLASTTSNYDPIGICVGPRGSRVKSLSEQLFNEKIEIISYKEDPKEFLVIAAGAKNIVGFKYNESKSEEDFPHATLVVTEESQPIIIGKKGYNIKLISKIAGCSIDIITVQEADESNFEYEKVVNVPHESRFPRGQNNYQSNNNNNNSANNNKPVNKRVNLDKYQSNDDLLSQFEYISPKERDKFYNDVTTNESINVNPNEKYMSMDDNLDLEEEIIDLSDEFADEINNVLNEKK